MSEAFKRLKARFKKRLIPIHDLSATPPRDYPAFEGLFVEPLSAEKLLEVIAEMEKLDSSISALPETPTDDMTPKTKATGEMFRFTREIIMENVVDEVGERVFDTAEALEWLKSLDADTIQVLRDLILANSGFAKKNDD